MPFNIQIIDNRVADSEAARSMLMCNGVIAVYVSGAEAAIEVERRKVLYNDSAPHFSYRIMKVEGTTEESDNWKKREASRFVNGQYTAVPWQSESWVTEGVKDSSDHFPHMSMDKSGMIAYTESPEKGRDDVQKRIRPGRYLTRFFYLVISPAEIKRWAGKVSLLSGESQEYMLAKTPDDIETVYVTGPSSCMGHEANHFESSEHPCRMYGAGDLAVAYIERESSIAARVLVWPAKKIWGKVYGDGGVFQDQLTALLEKDGYDHSSNPDRWMGARLIKICEGSGYIAPYLDVGGRALTDAGEYLEISYHGEIDATTETGVTGERSLCESCGEGYDAENEGGDIGDSSYCQSCYEEYAVFCEDCEITVHTENAVYLSNLERQVCDSCVSDYPTCDSCGENFCKSDTVYVESTNETICMDCFSNSYFTCEVCGNSDKSDNAQIDDAGDSLCETCHDEKVEAGETSSNRVENENQGEMSF